MVKARDASHVVDDMNRSSELLEKVLVRLNIAEWDMLLIGDGSGTTWKHPCGWCSVLIDRETRGRRLFHGAMNGGSNNFAEILPYVQALSWFHSNYGDSRLKNLSGLRVIIVTDSQYVANQGAQAVDLHRELPKVNSLLWASFRELLRLGYFVRFVWAKRATVDLNRLCDLIAGLSRKGLVTAIAEDRTDVMALAEEAIEKIRFETPSGLEPDLYAINPDHQEPLHDVPDRPS